MTTKTYTTKQLAITAAREALRAIGVKDPMSEVHFRVSADGEEFAWHQIDLGSGQMASGELISDGVAEKPYPPLPVVTKVPPKGAAKAKAAPKAAKPVSKREQARLAKIAAADAKNKAPKPPKAPRAPKPLGQRAEIKAAAERGVVPTPPDFTADTHKRFRKRLGEIVEMVKAGNIRGLKADTTEPKSSSRVALCRYRDLAITALEAQKKAAKAPPMRKAA